MKDKKLILSIITITIAVAALVLCFAATLSFADSSDTVYCETEEEAAAELREHMKQREESATVTLGLEGHVDQKDLEKLIGRLVKKALSHTGRPDEGDYLAFQYSSYKGYAHTTYVGLSPAVEIEYTLTYYDNARQEAEVDRRVREIIDGLGLDEKTDFEKIAAIHDYLCDNIDYEMSEKGSKVLLFYGACEGEGTSTTAANVALALSQMNRKVVLLDMDFNNPSLAKILKMEGIQFTDFSQYLENGGTDDALCKVPGTELTVSLNSKAYPQSIYKHSDQIKTFLDNISKKADFVIVDTLPGSLASDAEELNLMADASVIVVRENYSEVTDITNAIAAQEDSNHLLGCVFNCARRTDINADAARYGNGGHYVG